MIPSPITGKEAKIVDSFDTDEIIKAYKGHYNVDVTEYFSSNSTLNLYECNDTGLRFFYPYNLSGNDFFYQQLQYLPFYYADWKWDYEIAFNLIPENSRVLDIGCGRGAFLEKIKNEKKCDVMGLEFNTDAYKTLLQKNINASQLTIENYAVENESKFNVVCFFQVLEHIGNVNSFLNAAIKCLKPNGTLIIAVPYNKPYMYGNNKYETLNLPPHHMGWWDENSLQNLQNFYPIKFEKHFIKPFRDYNSYLNSLELNAAVTSNTRLKWLKLIRPINKIWVQIIRNKIPGGYILASYKKNNF